MNVKAAFLALVIVCAFCSATATASVAIANNWLALPWVSSIALLSLCALGALGLLKCSILYAMLGFASVVASVAVIGWEAVFPLLAMMGTIAAAAFSGALWFEARDRLSLMLRTVATAEQADDLIRSTKYAINPRCKGCHAESACPFQPGGVLCPDVDVPVCSSAGHVTP